MFPIPLVTSSEFFSVSLFWEIVQLYHDRPFLGNKHITAVTKVLFYKIECKGSFKHISDLFTSSGVLYERRKIKELSKENISVDFIKSFVEPYDKNVVLTEANEQGFNSDAIGTYITVQLLISKRNTDHKILEVAILDKDKNSAIFVGAYEENEPKLSAKFPYEFQLNGQFFQINVQTFDDADCTQGEWLADVLFPKLLKWSKYDPGRKNTIQTLSLIPIDEYTVIYGRLKKTYVEDLLKDWLEKTNTDPQKYIHEDLAIASYLICLWKQYLKEDINFVDCGCGNGLLVFILNQEGYNGYGIDIRKRAIWDAYPKETRLEVGTVTPESTFPNSTWLIGNHSDELTPWIPVMALKSSSKTNFFVLPCCPYDFNGEKYIRTNSSISTYSDYLVYIESICNKCKFKTSVDKMRIPSTKKVCLIGISTCSEEEIKSTIESMEDYLKTKVTSEFKPRSAVEPVRNCTQLKRELIDSLVHTCVNILLETEDFIKKCNGEDWNKGSRMALSDFSRKIPKADLKKLKRQCGGLQTLFRNFRYIFKVLKGSVAIRRPSTYSITKEKYRSKPCWFQKNHPNGCLNTAEDCSYLHNKY